MNSIRSALISGAWVWIPVFVGVHAALGFLDSRVSITVAGLLSLWILCAVFAAVLSTRIAIRDQVDARIWTLLLAGFGASAAAQLFFLGGVIAGETDVLGVPGVPGAVNVLAAVSLVAVAGILVGVGRGGTIIRARRVADLIGIMAVVSAALFAILTHIPGDGPGRLWSATHVITAVSVSVAVAFVVIGLKRLPWSDWKRALVAALLLYGIAAVIYHLGQGAGPLAASGVSDRVTASLLVVGHALVLVGALMRSRQESAGIDAPGDVRPVPGEHSSPLPALILSTLSVVAVPVLGVAALLAPRGSTAAPVYFLAAALSTASVVARTSLESIETGELRTKAGRDPLTGVPDLGEVRQRLGDMLRSAARYAEHLSVVVFDLDDFKTVNTLYGQEEGDRLIVEASRAVADAYPEYLLGRLGGDEFAVVAEHADSTMAIDIAHGMKRALAMVSTSAGLPLTASWGVATYPRDGEDPEDLIKKADGAQYWAKHHGKDRVVSYEASSLGVLNELSRLAHAEESSELTMLLAVATAYDWPEESGRYHSRNVAALAVLVARQLGLASEDIRDIEVAALLHDIGKIGVDPSVSESAPFLGEPGVSSGADFHAELGAMILESTAFSRLAPVVRAHHERWDGQGHPDGLAGDHIPLGARIIRVCDALERMSTGRGCNQPVSRAAALHELDHGMGIAYDPEVTEALIRVVGENAVLGWSEETVYR